MLGTIVCAPRAARSATQRASVYRNGRPPIRRKLLGAGASALLALSSGCNVFTVEQDVELGVQAYPEALGDGKVLRSGPAFEQVNRVTERLVASAKELDPDIATRFPWEVTVVDDPQMVNAWCLPGGKMAVYTGILPVTKDDAGLAVVMGHEIAHATKRHGTDRVSRTMGLQTAIAVLARTDTTAEIATVLAHLGFGLPWSRSHELEADRVGLLYMAKAGYDPREAVGFWQRMSELSGGAGEGLGEYLSTHPSGTRRIEEIQKYLPEALELYQTRSLAPAP